MSPDAAARLSALMTAKRSDGLLGKHGLLLPRLAAAYKWGWANTSHNCWHWKWDDALAQQRAYALLMARHMTANNHTANGTAMPPPQPECSIWGSLYNQVHVGWNRSLLHAIF